MGRQAPRVMDLGEREHQLDPQAQIREEGLHPVDRSLIVRVPNED